VAAKSPLDRGRSGGIGALDNGKLAALISFPGLVMGILRIEELA
jgi:hypothetical protein